MDTKKTLKTFGLFGVNFTDTIRMMNRLLKPHGLKLKVTTRSGDDQSEVEIVPRLTTKEKKLPKELPSVLKVLILQGVKRGGYDPEEALIFVEEFMTVAQAETARKFLTWINEKDYKIGMGNIDARFQAFLHSS